MSTSRRMTSSPGVGIQDLGAIPLRERKRGWVSSSRRGLIPAPSARTNYPGHKGFHAVFDCRALTALRARTMIMLHDLAWSHSVDSRNGTAFRPRDAQKRANELAGSK